MKLARGRSDRKNQRTGSPINRRGDPTELYVNYNEIAPTGSVDGAIDRERKGEESGRRRGGSKKKIVSSSCSGTELPRIFGVFYFYSEGKYS